MYAHLPGWVRHVEASKVFLVAPEGALAGVLSVEERVRSLAGIADLIGGRRVVSGPTPITNSEGEQGVLVTVEESCESPYRYEIGMLVGDEFSAVIIGVTRDPAHFERTRRAVRAMVADLPLFLGVRRRLFVYPSPAGWYGARRDMVTTWHPPAYPDDRARLIVHPALPRKLLPADELHQVLRAEICGSADRVEQQAWTDEYVTTRLGIPFRVSSTTISNVIVRLAIGEDNSYVYALRLEAENLDQVGALTTILDGIVPIDLREAQSLMDHWAT